MDPFSYLHLCPASCRCYGLGDMRKERGKKKRTEREGRGREGKGGKRKGYFDPGVGSTQR